MTKRFEVVMNEFDEVEYIMDKIAMEDRDFAEFIDFVEDICNENETELTNEEINEKNNKIIKQTERLLKIIEIVVIVTLILEVYLLLLKLGVV